MPEEHTYNQPPGNVPKPQQNVAPEASNQAGSGVYPQAHNAEARKPEAIKQPEAFSNFGEGSSSSAGPSVIVWMSFVLVLLLTGYFWLMDYNNVKSISEKENEKNQITAQLSSANNKEAEERALGFSSAFTELSNLTNNSVSKATLLTDLYSHFTKDVKLSNVSISKEGGLSLSGATGTYRQVADFMLGLKGYDKVSNISLKSVSLSTEEGTAANQKVTFSISSDIQMTKEAEAVATETDSSAASTSSAGATSTTTTPTTSSTPTSTSTSTSTTTTNQ